MNKSDRKTMFSHNTDEWGTPDDIFHSLDSEFHFDLDPCATDRNHKCKEYHTLADNGLKADWGGHCVFCNPPYSKMKLWAQKCYQESQKPNTLVVMLVPARTDTRWFHDYVYHKAELRFLKGRIKFVKNDGKQGDSAPFPSMIVIFGKHRQT